MSPLEYKREWMRKYRETAKGKAQVKRDHMLRVVKSVGLRPEDVGEKPILRYLQPLAEYDGYMPNGGSRRSRCSAL